MLMKGGRYIVCTRFKQRVFLEAIYVYIKSEGIKYTYTELNLFDFCRIYVLWSYVQDEKFIMLLNSVQ
jgi:hypothetical protein